MSRLAGTLRDDTTAVLQVLIRYLEGCHYGDPEKLSSTVATSLGSPHPGREAWQLRTGPAPADQGEPFGYQILNVDIDGDQAAATVLPAPPAAFQQSVKLTRTAGAWYITTDGDIWTGLSTWTS